MILYVDTSALIPLITQEPSSGVVAELWQSADAVVSSELARVEAAAALAMAARMDRIGRDQLGPTVEELSILLGDMTLISPTTPLLEQAASLAVFEDLRGYDAVHLASALAVNGPATAVAAGDHDLLSACSNQGLVTIDINRGADT
ncbi:type II toxin-antitoxin system VapC family toxin [Arthrobacter sp. H14]|uniref:type II toxin-antitoxin system VapC family toxin n=1 Tax=Arthrobacter sp. H14 TaxID=1312959 RepID=UPI00047D823D|nr:type II toxin-antitoxin system VapC family toxin [Arthrobacter sp. H14]